MSRARYWKQVKTLSRLSRQHRQARASSLVPALRDICERAGIEMRGTSHGWQFLRGEYIINWHPSSNKVRVQYRLPGHGRTNAFSRSGEQDKPRIVVALEELIEITRLDEDLARSIVES